MYVCVCLYNLFSSMFTYIYTYIHVCLCVRIEGISYPISNMICYNIIIYVYIIYNCFNSSSGS